MNKVDGRKNNDNSRAYHLEQVKKRKDALKEICQKIKEQGESKTFESIANKMQMLYDKSISVSAQTLRTNGEYRQIINEVLGNDNVDFGERKTRKNDSRTTAELRHELHKEKEKSAKLRSEIKILKHHIKQAGISLSDDTHGISDIQLQEQLDMAHRVLLEVLPELSKLGHFYWDREGFKRASDMKLFLTTKNMLQMGISPKLISNITS